MNDISNVPIKTGFTFKFVKNFNVQKLSMYLEDYTWSEIPPDSRGYDFYKESKYIPIEYISSIGPEGNLPITSSTILEDKNLLKLIEPIIDDLSKNFKGKIIRSSLIKLPAHKKILPTNQYKDFFSRISHNLYLIINSNEFIFFKVSKDLKRINSGECWEINNNLINTIWNISNDDLIYLTIDVMPKEYFEE